MPTLRMILCAAAASLAAEGVGGEDAFVSQLLPWMQSGVDEAGLLGAAWAASGTVSLPA